MIKIEVIHIGQDYGKVTVGNYPTDGSYTEYELPLSFAQALAKFLKQTN